MSGRYQAFELRLTVRGCWVSVGEENIARLLAKHDQNEQCLESERCLVILLHVRNGCEIVYELR